MKNLLVLTFVLTILSLVASAPYEYSKTKKGAEPVGQSTNYPSSDIKIVKSNSYETSVDPLQDKKYKFVKADCQSLGTDTQTFGNKEFKIRKIGCIYPGDDPIREDILQAVNNHFRTRLEQWANQS